MSLPPFTVEQAFVERLLHPSPSDAHPCRAVSRQLLILEDFERHLPISFVDLSRRVTAQSNLNHLLPHIVALDVQCESSHCLLAAVHWIVGLGPSLTSLSLRLPGGATGEVQASTLRAIRGRVPYLQHLEIEADLRGLTEGQALDLALQVVAFCDDLKGLMALSLPVEILEAAWQVHPQAVAGLPMLQELSLKTKSRTALSRRPPARAGGLNSLHTLRISAPMYQCADVVRTTSKNIKRLAIRSEFPEDAHVIAGTLRAITNFCSTTAPSNAFSGAPSSKAHAMSPANMNTLFSPRGIPTPVLLSSLTDIELTFLQGSPDGARLSTFAPLMSAHALCRLSIRHPYALSYTMDDLADMMGSWHSIQSLSLNPRPSSGVVNLSATPSLAVLSVVARCGPCLRDFHALLEGFGTSRPLPEHTWAPNLRTLDMGYSLGASRGEDMMETASYIRSLFRTVDIETEDCSDWVVKVAGVFGETTYSA